MNDGQATGTSADSFDRLWLKLRGIERIGKKGVIEHGPQQANRYSIIAAENDQGGIAIDGDYYPLRPGAVFICASGQHVQWIDPESGGGGLYLLRFESAGQAVEASEETTAGDERNSRPIRLCGEYHIAPAASVVEKCRLIERCWNSGKVPERFYGEAAFHELLGMLLSSPFQGTATMLERARQELTAHYAQAVSIDRLAELAGMSRYHFMRLFKEKYGKSVGDYVMQLRLNEAKRLMTEQTGLSLRVIAERVGYSNAAYFSHLFKRQVGFAPTVYLRNRTLKVAAYSWANIGQLLPLQIIPYAAPIDQYWNDYYRRTYDADVVVRLSHDYEFNREALRRARPDCIVALDYTISEAERRQLEQIAPVLFIPWEEADWREHLRLAAHFLNKSGEAEDWLARYDRRAEGTRRSLPDALREQCTLILQVSGRQLSIVGRRAASVLYDDLHFKLPAPLKEGNSWLRGVMAEQLAEYEASSIVVSVNDDAASQAAWMKLRQSEAWRGLQAVRDRAVFRLPGFPWFEFPWGEYSAFGHERMMEKAASGSFGMWG